MSVNDQLRIAIAPLAAIAGTLAAAAISVLVMPILFPLLLVATAVVAYGLAWWLEGVGQREHAAVPVPTAVAPSTPAAPAPDPRFESLVGAHVELARSLLEVRDLSTSPTAIARIDRALLAAGVSTAQVAPGSRFDHAAQYAATAVATDDPARDDTVAQVLVAGYVLGPHLLRAPQVAVYRTGLEADRG